MNYLLSILYSIFCVMVYTSHAQNMETNLGNQVWNISRKTNNDIITTSVPCDEALTINSALKNVSICFLDEKRLVLNINEYYPSAGFINSEIKGNYKVVNDNWIDIEFIEPKNYSNTSNKMQRSLLVMNWFAEKNIMNATIIKLPKIKTYTFKKVNQFKENVFVVALTLIGIDKSEYEFGELDIKVTKSASDF